MIFRVFFISVLLFSTIFARDLFHAITPIENANDYDPDRAFLGKELFFDTRLSPKKISCHACHNLEGKISGTSQTFNLPVPTILNASLNYYFGLDGQFSNLEDSIKAVIEDTDLYASSSTFMIKQIKKNPYYVEKFQEIYGTNIISYKNIINALAEFIRALKTPSRFDKFLLGDDDILSQEEKKGYNVFVKKGCVACHNGTNIGDGITIKIRQKNGTIQNHRVPTLRNILRTAPYMRINSPNIYAAITWLKNSIIGLHVTHTDITQIIIFFEALNGDTPLILKATSAEELKMLLDEQLD